MTIIIWLAVMIAALLGACTSTWAAVRPLEPGEEVVYQTVQSGPQYRTFFSQITGNGYTNLGDEIVLGNTARYITNIAIGTQTYKNANTAAYMDGVNSQQPPPGWEDQGGFLQLSLYLNDGPPDTADGNQLVDAPPHGQLMPGTLIATCRIPTPTYPTGGVGREDPNVNDFVLNFPFPNVYVPERFTFALVNLNAAGQIDQYNTDGNSFGMWHSTLSTSNSVPGSGGPHYNNTTFNTNVVGTSRTGAAPHTIANPGHWAWLEYRGSYRQPPTDWESDRDSNSGPDATMYARAGALLGDMDGDGDVDNFDIQPFELALTDPTSFASQYQRWHEDTIRRGDIDGDGDFDNFDIQPFEELLTSGVAPVPEPSTMVLLLLGAAGLLACQLPAAVRSLQMLDHEEVP